MYYLKQSVRSLSSIKGFSDEISCLVRDVFFIEFAVEAIQSAREVIEFFAIVFNVYSTILCNLIFYVYWWRQTGTCDMGCKFFKKNLFTNIAGKGIHSGSMGDFFMRFKGLIDGDAINYLTKMPCFSRLYLRSLIDERDAGLVMVI
jgi:hypothetical protein